MKKMLLQMIFAIGVAVSMTGCFSPSTADAGMEMVFIYKPWVFGHGGVDPVPGSTGLTWTVWSTQVEKVNIKPFNIDETFTDLVTGDNNPVDFKIHMVFKHKANGEDGGTPKLVSKFGKDWYKNKVREPLRKSVRSFTKQHKMFEMTTDANVTDQLAIIAKQEIEKYIKESGIPTELVLATVGRVMPPDEVVAATIQTAVQKQNVKTQNERVKAEEARKAAEVASAEADKAYMNKMKMSPNQYLAMKDLEIKRVAVDGAREGKIDLTLLMGGNPQPMFNVK